MFAYLKMRKLSECLDYEIPTLFNRFDLKQEVRNRQIKNGLLEIWHFYTFILSNLVTSILVTNKLLSLDSILDRGKFKIRNSINQPINQSKTVYENDDVKITGKILSLIGRLTVCKYVFLSEPFILLKGTVKYIKIDYLLRF